VDVVIGVRGGLVSVIWRVVGLFYGGNGRVGLRCLCGDQGHSEYVRCQERDARQPSV